MLRHSITHDKNSSDIRLDRNECICPSIVRNILTDANIVEDDYCKYTSAYNFIDLLSQTLRVNPDNIYLDNGSENVLKNLISVLPCSHWVMQYPTFELFSTYCELFNKKIQNVPFIYLNDVFSAKIPHSKSEGLYLVDPHNPTGISYSFEEIESYCFYYKYVIVDQAYLDPITVIEKQLPSNLIIVRTFSKLGGITGMRLGYCYSSNQEVIKKLNQFRPMFINSLTLKLGTTIISNNYTKKISNEFNQVKDLLKQYFKDNYILQCGNFILLKNISSYKGYDLKPYTISDKKLYRMTVFDKETFDLL